MGHTPTPWKAETVNTFEGGERPAVFGYTKDGRIQRIADFYGENGDDNAFSTALAVNAHAALVEALEEIASSCCILPPDVHCSCAVCIANAALLLAKAPK